MKSRKNKKDIKSLLESLKKSAKEVQVKKNDEKFYKDCFLKDISLF